MGQRATVRLAKELAIVDDSEQRVDAAAAALVLHFQEPLADTDIDGLAILTRVDRDAIHHAAAQAAESGAAIPVSPSNLPSLLGLPMIDGLCLILCWNVHGLNTSACREAVCELASAAKAGILCLQETKLHHIGAALARDIAGPLRPACAFLPADGTRGGIAIFWNPYIVDVNNFPYQRFSISATALCTAHSDHCPLLLTNFSLPPQKARFRFENFWPRHQGLLEVVSTAWNELALPRNPLARLCVKFDWAACSLGVWSGLFGDARQQLHLAAEIVLRLNEAQDHQPLSPLEFYFRKALKIRVLGLAAVERARRRQASRHVWLKEGDANTRFFHVKINVRRGKNFLHQIGTPSDIHVSNEDKATALFQHFDDSLGRTAPRTHTLAWQDLHLPRLPLAGIDNPFSLSEIWEAVKASPTEKAPGPDGFTGTFYRRCWSVIKFDILAAFHHLHRLAGGNLDALNTALICLIPKRDQVVTIGDLRPISLIHSFAKLFAKVLARRLTPLMGDLISHAQSAFIKTRCIHDNFLFVRNAACALHRAKKLALLIKLDFAKAFESVSWEYLLELMFHLGFPTRWRDWISMLFSSASSSVILNGSTGDKFFHRRGLRQGVPLSPLLFILDIDPLQRILLRATEMGALSSLPLQCVSLRASLYADDAIVFINPSRPDLQMLLSILDAFGTATGLRVNLAKCSIALIRCTNIDLDDVLQPFLGEHVDFPIRYLGLPLSLCRLRLAHVQPILDRARTRLAGWRGKWINADRRRALVSSVLSSLPIYAMTALRLPRCFISALDKVRRRFIWGIDEEEAAGGKCKVSWGKVCSPLDNGGLGLLNLDIFGRALRLRWLWFEWTAPTRPWVGMPTPCDNQEHALFTAVTVASIGDGLMASFWDSNWIGGAPLRISFPLLFARSRRKGRRVAHAITGHQWIADLRNDNTTQFVSQFLAAWHLLAQAPPLLANTPDSIRWTPSPNGVYSTKSAYLLHFIGRSKSDLPSFVWRQWTPPKQKFFAWLLLQDQLWCVDRLQRRCWPNCYFCPLCQRNLETSLHLFIECPFSHQVWCNLAAWQNCNGIAGALRADHRALTDFLRCILDLSADGHKKGVNSLFILTCWTIWHERINRIKKSQAGSYWSSSKTRLKIGPSPAPKP
ncbi:uncharacterized protein LOC104582150 [Brachypodium distachyon]|uniref:uncharacterized protein LOC104582150 n=1 Tax=Brachypodium distachyon TaxID=15368 RepID=UPI00052FE616|nr:uncharacterized protein LOC104582150 [Brachypodium distachyon]|eukprot:XP_010229804.1 uncharacterized protein LOC104582150 [Brachypodium distachyon]